MRCCCSYSHLSFLQRLLSADWATCVLRKSLPCCRSLSDPGEQQHLHTEVGAQSLSDHFFFFFHKCRARGKSCSEALLWILDAPSLVQSLPHSQGINRHKLIILPRAWASERERERERDGLQKDSKAAAVCIITPSVLWAWLDVIHCCFACLGMSNHCCHGNCSGAPVRLLYIISVRKYLLPALKNPAVWDLWDLPQSVSALCQSDSKFSLYMYVYCIYSIHIFG